MSRSQHIAVVAVLVVCSIAGVARSQEVEEKRSPLQFGGYIKTLTAFQFANHVDDAVTSNLIHNRINLAWDATPEFSAHLELRNRVFFGEEVKLVPNYGHLIAEDNGYLDLSVLWVDSRSLVVHTIADRAYLRYSDENIDVRLGRQRINWGINTVWNPNDLFNAYNFLDFDYEERPGSDAARVQYSVTPTSQIELAVAPSKRANDAIAAGLYRFNTAGYDVQVLGGLYRTDLVAGLGWAGSILDAGFKGELTYFHPLKPEFDSVDALSASVTLDNAFGEYYVTLSGLYNSFVNESASDVASLFSRSLSAKNLMPFRWSLDMSVMKSLSPLVNVSAAFIYSPRFNSLIVFPTVSYSLGQNVDADLVIESFFSDVTGIYRAEANAVFLRLRWSF